MQHLHGEYQELQLLIPATRTEHFSARVPFNMRKASMIATICVLAHFAQSSIDASEPHAPKSPTHGPVPSLRYDEALRCGPNSLLIFLILKNVSSVSYDDLLKTPVNEDGTSLRALHEVALGNGVKNEIRLFSVDDVDKLPMPAIMLNRASPSAVSGLHYDVLYKRDSEYLYALNGTTGSKMRINRKSLRQYWTGYALIPLDAEFDWLAMAAALGFTIAIVLIFSRTRK